MKARFYSVALFVLLAVAGFCQQFDVQANYDKKEVYITMRDGIRLFTSIYTPKDQSQLYPIMMMRTPYSVRPYGDAYRTSLGPSNDFARSGYTFVYQDVRGRYMSEGDFKWMTPYIPNKSGKQVDESTDTYDTIQWLIENIPNNNGRVGQWGISFPGFYTAAGMIDAHPALKASSPQAPMCDNWLGDDMHHNGAFFLPHAMNFIAGFGKRREGPTQDYGPRVFQHGTNDGYKFFLEMGPLRNANTKYNMNQIELWQQWMDNGDYNEYWQAQNVPQHMKNIRHAVLVVGGWFDAEDLYGPLALYKAIDNYNPGHKAHLVMGPWYHGTWSSQPGDALHDIRFVERTGEYFRDSIQFPFFEYYLKDRGSFNAPKLTLFNTGANRWLTFSQFPPDNAKEFTLYLGPNGRLSQTQPGEVTAIEFAQYENDPANPVPFTAAVSTGMPRQYLLEDQRFAQHRNDILRFQTEVLEEDITLGGPVEVSLWIATSGTDADYIVKLIDVYPDNAPNDSPRGPEVQMGGYQMLVRGEPMRAKYRHSWTNPSPLTPNQPTLIRFTMPDVLHTFNRGHRIMVHVQSSWFPLVDRNPQTFTDIYKCGEEAFVKADHRVYFSRNMPSKISVRWIQTR
jgi:putative CocE/NonD family hydrolase